MSNKSLHLGSFKPSGLQTTTQTKTTSTLLGTNTRRTNDTSTQANISLRKWFPLTSPAQVGLAKHIPDCYQNIIYSHRLSKNLQCLEATVTGAHTVFRSFIEGKRGSQPRLLNCIRHLIGWSETSTLATAFLTRRQCLHLISSQNAPFSTVRLRASEGVIDSGDQVDRWYWMSAWRSI